MGSEIVLIINALLYTSVLFYFLLKFKLSVGAIIWLLYTVSAWATVFFVQHPYYVTGIHESEQRILPCIYMFFINFVSMYPLAKFKGITEIRFTGERILVGIMAVCSIFQIIFFIVEIPNLKLILDLSISSWAAIRDAGYSSSVSLVEMNPFLNRFYLLFSGMRIIASGLSVYLILSYEKHRKLVWLFFITTFLNNVRLIIVSVGRGEVVLLFLFYACMFYSLRFKIGKKVFKKILLWMIPVAIVGVSFFWAVTISRFGEYAEYSMYKYLGEPMNNFNGLLFYEIEGTTNGRAYFSLIYRYLFGETDFINTTEKWELINKMTGINGSIFYTWIGGLMIEFGKAVPLIVSVILNRFMDKLCKLKEYYIGDLIVIIFFINFYIRGIFIFPTQNFEGIFLILYTIVLYFIFRTRKKEDGRIVYVRPQK